MAALLSSDEPPVGSLPALPPRTFHYTFSKNQRPVGRSMRTIRSKFNNSNPRTSLGSEFVEEKSPFDSENLTDSAIDLRLSELAAQTSNSAALTDDDEFLDLSQAFSDFSNCSSYVSCELRKLSILPSNEASVESPIPEEEPCFGFLEREDFSTEIVESISPVDLQPTVMICVKALRSPSMAVRRSAAAKLRLLAKNRPENRALIGESGAVPALIPLLASGDPSTQETAVTALLNLSLYGENTELITRYGAIPSLVYVLKSGTSIAKQNAACALLSLALVDENKVSIGACGAIPPLVSLVLNGTERGKKDALTVLYKLCSVKKNKERAVAAGVVKPLVSMVTVTGDGLSEKAMVILSVLSSTREGGEGIVKEGGVSALVDVVEDGTLKGKEFAVVTLFCLCVNSLENRGAVAREGCVPALLALSRSGATSRARNKAEALLRMIRG